MQIKTSMNELLFEKEGKVVFTVYKTKSNNFMLASTLNTLLMYHSALINIEDKWYFGVGIIIDFTGESNDKTILLEKHKDISELCKDEEWVKNNSIDAKMMKEYKIKMKKIMSLESTDQLSLNGVMQQKELNEKILISFAIDKLQKLGRKKWR